MAQVVVTIVNRKSNAARNGQTDGDFAPFYQITEPGFYVGIDNGLLAEGGAGSFTVRGSLIGGNGAGIRVGVILNGEFDANGSNDIAVSTSGARRKEIVGDCSVAVGARRRACGRGLAIENVAVEQALHRLNLLRRIKTMA